LDVTSVTIAGWAPFFILGVNTTYYARVRASHWAGRATDWAQLGSTVTLASAPLSQALTFTAVNVSSLTFQWQANGNPQGTLYLAEISSFSGLAPLSGSSATVLTQAIFFDLQANTTYYLQVKARNHGGTETTYAGLGSTVTRAAVPQALAYSDVSTGTLKANWTKNSNPEGTLYTVELDDDSQFSSIAFTSVTIGPSWDPPQPGPICRKALFPPSALFISLQ
ncbi:MAG: fibronectin type III domain-containing protein, partial [Elusimicrobia bacterium]|nr:fibronectin type III domain-containing protein [Elusimicrobiota bacterium]